MAYIFPTVDDFRTKFPEFSELSDEAIQILLDDAGRAVDQTWTEGDYSNAILFLAAHYHELDLMATTSSDATAEGVPAGQTITSEHIGPISVSYGKAGAGASSGSGGVNTSTLDNTVYGQRYHDLLIKNIPAVLVI
jgi:hypothetical protein